MFKYLLKTKTHHNSSTFMKFSINLWEPCSNSYNFWLPLYLDTNVNRLNKRDKKFTQRWAGWALGSPGNAFWALGSFRTHDVSTTLVPQPPHVTGHGAATPSNKQPAEGAAPDGSPLPCPLSKNTEANISGPLGAPVTLKHHLCSGPLCTDSKACNAQLWMDSPQINQLQFPCWQ